MNAILNILTALGLNQTVVYQFIVFIVTFLFLDLVVFRPYLRAYQERRRRTVDSKDVAKELRDEIQAIEVEYSKEAKAINGEVKKAFNTKREEAQKESSAILANAQLKAQEKISAGKASLQDTYKEAREQMKTFVPELGKDIQKRLMDR